MKARHAQLGKLTQQLESTKLVVPAACSPSSGLSTSCLPAGQMLDDIAASPADPPAGAAGPHGPSYCYNVCAAMTELCEDGAAAMGMVFDIPWPGASNVSTLVDGLWTGCQDLGAQLSNGLYAAVVSGSMVVFIVGPRDEVTPLCGLQLAKLQIHGHHVSILDVEVAQWELRAFSNAWFQRTELARALVAEAYLVMETAATDGHSQLVARLEACELMSMATSALAENSRSHVSRCNVEPRRLPMAPGTPPEGRATPEPQQTMWETPKRKARGRPFSAGPDSRRGPGGAFHEGPDSRRPGSGHRSASARGPSTGRSRTPLS
mmetsp:Transcript_12038/g.34067  ORF Transcript_12038/g.34067 Transcript_12038/m.34067 type:complete len:320 (+) Transcript_12038:115-1074(+)